MVKNLFTVKTILHGSEEWQKAATALEQCLRQIPGAHIAMPTDPAVGDDFIPDLSLEVQYGVRKRTIFAVVKKRGEPLFARIAINELERFRQVEPTAFGILIAPYISQQTAKLCQEENIGTLDFAGNCHITFDGIYIHVEGKSNPAAHSRSLRSLYQPKAERVLRVLLTRPATVWRLQSLAHEAKVSVGQSFKVKELLRQKDWLEETTNGVRLTKPRDLLTDWAAHYSFGKHQASQFYTLSDLDTIERGLSYLCGSLNRSCAFTGLTAAARYAAYATYQRTTAYVSGSLTPFQEPLGLEPVETGANVILVTPYDEGVFYDTKQIEGISLASPLQTYLDLQSTGARGREAADFLLQKEIIPQW